MNNYIHVIGRILFSLIFLVPGINKIMNFADVQNYMTSKGMPMTGPLLVCAIILLLFGAFSIGFGYKSKIGTIALIIFLVPATLIFHTDFSDQNQPVHFLKNLALIGGLLMIFANITENVGMDKKISKNMD